MTTRRRGLLAVLLVVIAGLIVLAVLHQPPRPAEANHAWTHAEGVGYDGIGPGFGWVNVYAAGDTTTLYAEAMVAIDKWRAFHTSDDGSLWWLRHSTDLSDFNDAPGANGYPGVGSAEVLDSGNHSVFCCNPADDWYTHSLQCYLYFANGANHDSFAVTFVSDRYGQFRYLDSDGYWAQDAGVPFHHATVCLNPYWNNQSLGGLDGHNNPGTIAHEFGHVLGLDHPLGNAVNVTACPTPAAYTGYDTIMAYNYSGLSWLWPVADGYGTRGPTSADIDGPWVCNWGNAGGLSYIYGVHTGGFGIEAITPTPTPTSTDTPRPTRTPTPTSTPTPLPDSDGDGLWDGDEVNVYGTNPLNPDTDGDGCGDGKEVGPNHALGGERDPLNRWDFYDVSSPKDGRVTATDIALVQSKFGLVAGNPGYDESFDRSAGLHSWAPGAPNGRIDATDVALVNAEFGNTCVG